MYKFNALDIGIVYLSTQVRVGWVNHAGNVWSPLGSELVPVGSEESFGSINIESTMINAVAENSVNWVYDPSFGLIKEIRPRVPKGPKRMKIALIRAAAASLVQILSNQST